MVDVEDVVVALVSCDKVFGTRIFFDEQILGHQVKLYIAYAVDAEDADTSALTTLFS